MPAAHSRVHWWLPVLPTNSILPKCPIGFPFGNSVEHNSRSFLESVSTVYHRTADRHAVRNWDSVKGNMHTISPGRNRVNFQILAYLLTIDLLYGTGCLSYWFCSYMLRLDSSEMLPGSQKGEETTAILKTHARLRHFGSPYSLYYGISMVGTGNDHVTPRGVTDARCS